MKYDFPLTFKEFLIREQHPLAMIHDCVLTFLEGRDDCVLFGAQAVNLYVDEVRMTEDIDLYSNHAEALAESIRAEINDRFHIAVRVRSIKEGAGFWIYQLQGEQNRHLVDVRQIDLLPPSTRVQNISVLKPAELVAEKIIAFESRKLRPKAGSDWRDILSLLLRFPKLKTMEGDVSAALQRRNASQAIMDSWKNIVSMSIISDEDDADLTY